MSAKWRVVRDDEVVQRGDEYVSSGGQRRPVSASVGFNGAYMRKERPDLTIWTQRPEPTTKVACGCGKHDIDPAGDIHTQHREWLRARGLE